MSAAAAKRGAGAGAGAGASELAVCLKWVDRRPEVDPLTGAVRTDARSSGASEADLGALELALRLAGEWGATVAAVTAAGAEAEPMLREALAAGAARAVRVDVGPGWSSAAAAAALAPAVTGAAVVLCGAWSLDRGSGAVPAFLAAELGAAQALGLVTLSSPEPGRLEAERRLDGGRRERLALRAPAVVSLEAGLARLRRASLDGVRAAAGATIEVVSASRATGTATWPEPTVGPYRPRAKVLAAPAGGSARERILALTGAGGGRAPARVLDVGPDEGAAAVLEQLATWGYLSCTT